MGHLPNEGDGRRFAVQGIVTILRANGSQSVNSTTRHVFRRCGGAARNACCGSVVVVLPKRLAVRTMSTVSMTRALRICSSGSSTTWQLREGRRRIRPQRCLVYGLRVPLQSAQSVFQAGNGSGRALAEGIEQVQLFYVATYCFEPGGARSYTHVEATFLRSHAAQIGRAPSQRVFRSLQFRQAHSILCRLVFSPEGRATSAGSEAT